MLSGSDSVDLLGSNLKLPILHQITVGSTEVSGKEQHSKDREFQLPWTTLRVTTVLSQEFWFLQYGHLGVFHGREKR